MGENAIVDAFEMAASSYAVNHGLPGARFYHPGKEKTVPEVAQPAQPAPPAPPAKVPRSGDTRAVYPPPVPEADPDRLRLLHSWYWAGYYTGLADGKRQRE